MKKISLLIGFAFLFVQAAFAQDFHFSQFYASPLNLNPAMTGAIDGKYRASIIYRNQWSSILPQPYRTFSGAFDMKFNLKFSRNDHLGVGLMFYSDKAGTSALSTTQIALSGAYHKSLDMYGKNNLSLGVQVGIGQRTLNYDGLTFNDQFNGVSGYTGTSAEQLPINNASYPDLSTGLFWSYAPTERKLFYAGMSLYHFNAPNLSLFQGTSSPAVRLPVKISAQVGAQIPFGDRNSKISFAPRIVTYLQGPHFELDAGTNFRFMLDDYGDVSLHVGTWARPVGGVSGLGLDAVVFVTGIEFKGLIAGISYDLNLSKLNSATNGRGGFELSISYTGNIENDSFSCPKF